MLIRLESCGTVPNPKIPVCSVSQDIGDCGVGVAEMKIVYSHLHNIHYHFGVTIKVHYKEIKTFFTRFKKNIRCNRDIYRMQIKFRF